MSVCVRSISFVVALGVLAPGAGRTGQEPDVTLYGEVARALRRELPVGLVLLEPRYLSEGTSTPASRPLTDAARTALQGGLGADTATLRDVVSCTGRLPNTCRFLRGVAVVRLGLPTLLGDTARVAVHYAMKVDSHRTPIGEVEVLFVLVLRPRVGWQVIERRLLAMT